MLNVTYELKMKVEGADMREYYTIQVQHPNEEISPFDTYQKFLEFMAKEAAALNIESNLLERKGKHYRVLANFLKNQSQ